MNTAKDYIAHFDMTAHPEGGYFKEVYKHAVSLEGASINPSIKGQRAMATSIYFLLEDEQISHLHVLKSDEIWYYHDGQPLTIVMIDQGQIHQIQLGLDIAKGQVPQFTVPAGTIFGSYSNEQGHFSLVSCMVSPGFEFEDFQLIDAKDLIPDFPDQADFIRKMCLK